MLPPPHRLRRSDDVLRVRRRGRRWQHPLITLFVDTRPQESISSTRFAFAAGRHVGKATIRNRAKRRLREIVRRNLDHIESGHDCLLVARQSTSSADHGELEQAVCQLLRRAGLWNETGGGRSLQGSPQ